jgi:hypothetical protein
MYTSNAQSDQIASLFSIRLTVFQKPETQKGDSKAAHRK